MREPKLEMTVVQITQSFGRRACCLRKPYFPIGKVDAVTISKVLLPIAILTEMMGGG